MKTLDLTNLENSEIKYKINNYPDGQRDIVIEKFEFQFGLRKNQISILIKSRLNNAEDLLLIVCSVKALRNLHVKEIHLYVPYIVGARSDRKFSEGGIRYFSQVVTPILNDLEFETITCIDIHSDVAENVINNLIIKDNSNLIYWALTKISGNNSVVPNWDNEFIFISPDAGASKKIYKLAEKIGYKGEIVVCSKDRDLSTGKLTRTEVPLQIEVYNNKDFIIIDDICDGGATFINIAKEIRRLYPDKNNKIYLIVTHGIFSKGFGELRQYFDGIYCTNSYCKVIAKNFVEQLNVF